MAFIEDTVRNQIARKLSDAFFQYYGYPPAKVGSRRLGKLLAGDGAGCSTCEAR